MALPLIPFVLIGIGTITGAGGGGLWLKGGRDIKKANDRIGRASAGYEDERSHLVVHEAETNAALARLGTIQERAIATVVMRMADFLRRHAKQVAEGEKLLVDGLEESMTGEVELEEGLGQDAASWVRGIVASTATGVGVNAGITTAVTTLATASTGTAISTLSGAAATNATLAFLGGGSLATGGAGMAAGAAALNLVTIGPAILVSGFVVAGQGEKAKTKASEGEAALATAMAGMKLTKASFDAVVQRACEIEELLAQLCVSATGALGLLESEPFEASEHAERFRNALTLAVAVRDVATTQIVDEAGDLSEEAASIKIRYRPLIKEIEDA